MANTKDIDSYIEAFPDFMKFINGEYNKLDDTQYAELFFNEIYRLNWYEGCLYDVLAIHAFKPKFEAVFIERIISNNAWCNNNISIVKRAIENGYIDKNLYDNIFTAVIAKDGPAAASLFYNVKGFEKYNNIIEVKCLSVATGSQLIDILQENETDIEMKNKVLSKIVCENSSYISNAIDSIMALKNKKQRDKLINDSIHGLINKNTIEHFCFMTTFYDIQIPYNTAKKIHEKCGPDYFKNNIRRFERIKRYCYTFGHCLTDYERDIFFKRLQTATRHKNINKAMKLVDFTDEQQNKLKSCILLYNLAE